MTLSKLKKMEQNTTISIIVVFIVSGHCSKYPKTNRIYDQIYICSEKGLPNSLTKSKLHKILDILVVVCLNKSKRRYLKSFFCKHTLSKNEMLKLTSIRFGFHYF